MGARSGGGAGAGGRSSRGAGGGGASAQKQDAIVSAQTARYKQGRKMGLNHSDALKWATGRRPKS